MDSDLFADAQRYVGQLLSHLEELHAALDIQSRNAAGKEALPEPFVSIFRQNGALQGMYLKTQGFLSADLQEFMRGLAYSFELEIQFPGAFRLPFVGGEILLQRKTLNPFHESAWEFYHAGLLSAYALRPLAFDKPAVPADTVFDLTLRVIESPPEGDSSSRLPQLEKKLSGLALLAEELGQENGVSASMKEKLRVLRDSAAEAAGLF